MAIASVTFKFLEAIARLLELLAPRESRRAASRCWERSNPGTFGETRLIPTLKAGRPHPRTNELDSSAETSARIATGRRQRTDTSRQCKAVLDSTSEIRVVSTSSIPKLRCRPPGRANAEASVTGLEQCTISECERSICQPCRGRSNTAVRASSSAESRSWCPGAHVLRRKFTRHADEPASTHTQARGRPRTPRQQDRWRSARAGD